ATCSSTWPTRSASPAVPSRCFAAGASCSSRCRTNSTISSPRSAAGCGERAERSIRRTCTTSPRPRCAACGPTADFGRSLTSPTATGARPPTSSVHGSACATCAPPTPCSASPTSSAADGTSCCSPHARATDAPPDRHAVLPERRRSRRGELHPPPGARPRPSRPPRRDPAHPAAAAGALASRSPLAPAHEPARARGARRACRLSRVLSEHHAASAALAVPGCGHRPRHPELGAVDALYAQWLVPFGWGCLRAARRAGIPCLAIARGADLNLWGRRRALRRQLLALVEQVDALLGNGEWVRPALARAAGGDPGRPVDVVYNPCDLSPFFALDRDDTALRAAVRARLGLPHDAPTVLF